MTLSRRATMALAALAALLVLAVAVATLLDRPQEGYRRASPPAVALWTLPDQRGVLQPIPTPAAGRKSVVVPLGGRRFQSIHVPRGYRVRLYAFTGNSAVLWRDIRGKANLARSHERVDRVKVFRLG